jgi:hypothetical protein
MHRIPINTPRFPAAPLGLHDERWLSVCIDCRKLDTVTENEGVYVCVECGLVQGRVLSDMEWIDDDVSMRRAAPRDPLMDVGRGAAHRITKAVQNTLSDTVSMSSLLNRAVDGMRALCGRLRLGEAFFARLHEHLKVITRRRYENRRRKRRTDADISADASAQLQILQDEYAQVGAKRRRDPVMAQRASLLEMNIERVSACVTNPESVKPQDGRSQFYKIEDVEIPALILYEMRRNRIGCDARDILSLVDTLEDRCIRAFWLSRGRRDGVDDSGTTADESRRLWLSVDESQRKRVRHQLMCDYTDLVEDRVVGLQRDDKLPKLNPYHTLFTHARRSIRQLALSEITEWILIRILWAVVLAFETASSLSPLMSHDRARVFQHTRWSGPALASFVYNRWSDALDFLQLSRSIYLVRPTPVKRRQPTRHNFSVTPTVCTKTQHHIKRTASKKTLRTDPFACALDVEPPTSTWTTEAETKKQHTQDSIDGGDQDGCKQDGGHRLLSRDFLRHVVVPDDQKSIDSSVSKWNVYVGIWDAHRNSIAPSISRLFDYCTATTLTALRTYLISERIGRRYCHLAGHILLVSSPRVWECLIAYVGPCLDTDLRHDIDDTLPSMLRY